VLGYAILSASTVAVMLPLLWMVSCSFKPGGEIFAPPQVITEARKHDPNATVNVVRVIGDMLTPDKPTTQNYSRLFKEIHFQQYFINSVFTSTASTLLTLFFCALGGFAFAKYLFPGKNALFGILLGSMMIPFHVLLVPLFAMMSGLHWFDTYTAIIVPFSASAFGIFLMRQYTLSIPDQMLDAARMDGASEWQVFWSVALPMVRPALGALTIFTFMNAWNNYLWPLIVLRSDERYTLPLGLSGLVGPYDQEYGMLMAGTLLSTLPIIVLFLAMQREFVSGITLGSVKE
jgi:ABC-type glycerol-3-phosphate transport system permease component